MIGAVAAVVTLAAAGVTALPDEPVQLESATTAFTPAWELALADGKAWRRRRHTSHWELLPPAGVPAPSARIEAIKELVLPLARDFDRAGPLWQLSADGENIVVIDDRRRVYYAKLGSLAFTDVWGPPSFSAPLMLPADTVSWAISHRAQPYQDIDGNVHPVSAGVTTLYALTGDGRIAYQDPWLPPPAPGARWQREVCPPERGALTLVSLAASASTLAVMDDGGRVHTRLADFDTLGHNPALLYSWRRERRSGLEENIRSLPGEEWRLQPEIPGPHGAAITVFFTGEGNARRRLRVEAQGGFFEKELEDATWRFVPQVLAPAVVLMERRATSLRAARGEALHGQLGKALIEVDDFDLQCPGARVRVHRDGEEVQLRLWHVERLLELDDRELDLRGALILTGSPQGKLADEVRALFGGDVHEVEVDVRDHYLEVKSAAADLKKLGRTLGVPRKLRVRLKRS